MINIFCYIIIMIFGLLIGSFLNVCIYRVPRKESVVKPHSHCTNCGTRIKPFDLIPILSYIVLLGKCRYCGNKISIKYPMVELITAIIYASLFNKYGLKPDFFAGAFLMTILIPIFFIDIEHSIIPNAFGICGFIGGALLICFNMFFPIEIYMDRIWWNPILGVFIGSVFLIFISIVGRLAYKTDAMGMGDIKLFAVIGAFLGWRMTIFALAVSFLLAGLLGFISIVKKPKSRKEAMPLGPYIVIGTYVTIMWGWDLFELLFAN